MKSKDKVAVFQELLNKGCFETNAFISQREDKDFFFDVAENPSRTLTIAGKPETYFGLVASVIVREEGKQPEFKKLYDRSYKLVGRKLTEVREQAYAELLDVVVATFLLSAYRTPVETLQEVSNPVSHEA